MRVACVGDSITFGAGLAEPQRQSYPAVLQNLLSGRARVANFGVSGATALKRGTLPYWETEEYKAALEFDPDVVIIVLGTNDAAFENRNERHAFESDLRDLGRSFARGPDRPKIFLGLPPPCFGWLFSYRERTLSKELRPAIRRVAREEGWGLVDLFRPLESRGDLFPDGIHPNAGGAEALARLIFEQIVGESSPIIGDEGQP